MPQFIVTSPGGQKFRITAPNGATQDQVLTYAKDQFSKMQQPSMVHRAIDWIGKEDPFDLTGLYSRTGKALSNATEGIRQGAKEYEQGTRVQDAGQTVRGMADVAGGVVGSAIAPFSGALATAEKGLGEGIYRARGGMGLEKGMSDKDIAAIHQKGEQTAQEEGEKWAALASMIGGGEAARPKPEVRPAAEPLPPRPAPRLALPPAQPRLALPAPKEVPQGIVVDRRGRAVTASPYSTKNPATGLPTGQMGYAPNEPLPPRTQADRIKEVAASVAPKPKAATTKPPKVPAPKGRPAAESFDTGDELDRLLDNQLSRIDKTTRMDKAVRQFNRENAPKPAVSDFGRKVREATEGMFKAAKSPKGALRAEAINKEAAKLANVLKQMEKSKGALTAEQVQTVKAAVAEARRARQEAMVEKPSEAAAQKKSPAEKSSTPSGVGEVPAKETPLDETHKVFEEADTPEKMKQAAWIFNELKKKSGRDRAINMEMRRRLEEAKAAGLTDELEIKMARLKERGRLNELTPQERKLYDKYVKPVNDMQDRNYRFKLESEGLPEEKINLRPNFVHRRLKTDIGKEPNVGGWQLPGSRSFTRKTSSWKSNVYWALEDEKGNRVVAALNPQGGKTLGIILEKGKPERRLSFKTPRTLPGTVIKFPDGRRFTIKEAYTDERARATGLPYDERLLQNSIEDARHGSKVVENIKLLDRIKTRMLARGTAYQGKHPPEGFVETHVPQLRGVYFDRRLAETLNDFYRQTGTTAEDAAIALDNMNNAMVRWMFVNPLRHMLNVTAQYLVNRGLDNFTHPLRIGKYIKSATNDVENFTPFYRQWMEAGGGDKYPGALETKLYNRDLNTLRKELYSKEYRPLLKAWGLKTQEATRALLDASNTSLWKWTDIVGVARVKELMETKGMTMKQAIKRTHEHLGDYSVESRIGEKTLNRIFGEDIGGKASRGISALGIQHNPVAIFMRYKYDLMKGWGHTIRKMAIGDRKAAFGEMMTLAALTATTIYGEKAVVAAVFGQDAANKWVPVGVGPTSLLVAFYNAYTGKTHPRNIATGLMTLNPVARTAQEFYTGQMKSPLDLAATVEPLSEVYYPMKEKEDIYRAAFQQVMPGYFKK